MIRSGPLYSGRSAAYKNPGCGTVHKRTASGTSDHIREQRTEPPADRGSAALLLILRTFFAVFITVPTKQEAETQTDGQPDRHPHSDVVGRRTDRRPDRQSDAHADRQTV